MSVLKSFYLSLMTLLIGFNLLSMNLVNASEDIANSTDIANSAIETAETAVISAFEAVTEAEKAGANVTGLLTNLTEAGEFLAAARMSQRNGDFDNATHLASLSRNIGEEVRISAYELKDLAWNEGLQRMWFTILGSVSGIILVVLGSLWTWRVLERRDQK